MDSVGGPDAKKARWSPTSFNGTTQSNGLAASANSGTTNSHHDAFANYGYGPQASISQSFQPSSSPGFTPNALYSTPSLSINTAVNGQGMQMSAQMSPHAGGGFTQQQQAGHQGHVNGGSPYSASGFGYGMLGMGLPSVGMLGGFPYSSHSGNFGQVCPAVCNGAWCLTFFVATTPSFAECQYSAYAWSILPRCSLRRHAWPP